MITSLILVIIAFIISSAVQIIISRGLQKKHIRSMRHISAYGIGLMILIVCWFFRMVPLPFTSILLYLMASIIVMWLLFGTFLGGETPSFMILASYRKKEGKTEAQLQRLFTLQGLLWKRFDDLVLFGYVSKRNNRYTLTQKGRLVLRCIFLYQKVFNRKEIG